MTTTTARAPGRPQPTETREIASRAGEPAVALTGLTKRYRERVVVDAVDLRLEPGEVCGLIGPNGAGKTTLMAMLLGLVAPSAGSGHVLGHPLARPSAYLPGVGALIEGPAFPHGSTGRACLRALATLGGHDHARISPVLATVGLAGREDDPVRAYSLGMRQRLGIAAALLPDPRLVVLDEPANGLDPVGMTDLRRIVRTMADEGRSVLLSSHLLGELDQVCDQVVVMEHGQVRYAGEPGSLPRSRSAALALEVADPRELPRLVDLARRLGPVRREGAGVLIGLGDADPAELAARANTASHDAGIVLSRLEHRHTDLESRYLELISEDR